MGAEDNALTLRRLAQRLEALEHENAELRSEVDALRGSSTRRDGAAGPRGSEPPRDGEAASEFDGRVVSRKKLLSKAGTAAAVAAGTLLGSPRQAEAHDATGVIDVDTVEAHVVNARPHDSTISAINAELTSARPGIESRNSGTGPGVSARSASGGPGVYGSSVGQQEAGVQGVGVTGVWGLTSTNSYSGVYGEHTGASGYGTVGIGRGTVGAGVLGRNDAGYGGQFEGGRAQLKLKPGASTGKPGGSHVKGEIYMDSAGMLFVCTKGGTPGSWRKVSTTAV